MAHRAAAEDDVLHLGEALGLGEAHRAGAPAPPASGSPSLSTPIALSQTISAKIAAVAPQVHQGRPLRACIELKKCRIVTPIRNTSAAISQLYCEAKASG